MLLTSTIANPAKFLDEWRTRSRTENLARVSYKTWQNLVRLQDRPWDYMSVKSMPNGDYIHTIRAARSNDPDDFIEFVIPDIDINAFHHAVWCITSSITPVPKTIENNTTREDKNMSMNIMNKFDFGTCDRENFRLSPYGLAIRNSTGSWVSYDPATSKIVEVDIFNFGSGKYFFKMPVAVKDVKVGDIIVHNTKPVFVTNIDKTNITVVDPTAGEVKTVIPATNIFNFDFITKIICPFTSMIAAGGGATADQPFGNILPFILMSEDKDIDPMMLAMIAGGGSFDFSNPMMMYALCASGDRDSSMLPLMLLMSQNSPKQ